MGDKMGGRIGRDSEREARGGLPRVVGLRRGAWGTRERARDLPLRRQGRCRDGRRLLAASGAEEPQKPHVGWSFHLPAAPRTIAGAGTV